MPNLLLIGAAKGGSTALYRYLSGHPDIYMSQTKEPRYFAFQEPPRFDSPFRPFERNLITDPDQYRALFAGREEAIRGEGSTLYLYSPSAPDRIKAEVPEARLIASLRNPVDRAFSHWQYFRREGLEPVDDFTAALDEEPGRLAANWGPYWSYRDMGMYAEQLSRYFECFDSSQIKVIIFEEWRTDPAGAVADLYDFLDVPPNPATGSTRAYNVSGIPRSRRLHRFLKGANPVSRGLKRVIPTEFRRSLKQRVNRANLVRLAITPQERAQLSEFYRPEVERIEDLLKRDLSVWKNRRD